MPLNEKNPDWLDSLKGDSPLLEQSEWEFIAEVRRGIIHETRTIPGFPCDKQLRKELSVMKEKFAEVVKYLKENSQSKEYFLCTYPKWRTVRNLTILQLKGIARSVDKDSQNCSVSRGVGSSVSLVGGLMCLASKTAPLQILGSVLMGLGSVTSAGTSAVELELLRKKIKKAEKIIQEDREYSEELWDWISDKSYIQDALITIRCIDVDINLKKAANDFHAYFKRKSDVSELKANIAQAMKFLRVSPEIINEISDVVGILTAMSMLYDRYRPCFNVAIETYRCNKVLSTAYDVILSALKMTLAIDTGKNSELTNFQKSKIVSGIALDALNIIFISKNINSKSKEAKEIIKAAEKLKEEAVVFSKLYDAVNYL